MGSVPNKTPKVEPNHNANNYMVEENIEDTEENPEVEETPVTENPPEEKDAPKEKTKETYTEREKRYYARMKESEDIAKKAKLDLAKAKEDLAKAKLPISDIDAILEVQSSTRDLDTEEVAELKLRASSLGISLSEARKNQNFSIWQKAHREMVEKEKALAPNTNQGEVEKPKSIDERFKAAKTQEEKEKQLDEYGWNPLKPRRDYTTL